MIPSSGAKQLSRSALSAGQQDDGGNVFRAGAITPPREHTQSWHMASNSGADRLEELRLLARIADADHLGQVAGQLRQLAELAGHGHLTQQEFASAKKQLLTNPSAQAYAGEMWGGGGKVTPQQQQRWQQQQQQLPPPPLPSQYSQPLQLHHPPPQPAAQPLHLQQQPPQE